MVYTRLLETGRFTVCSRSPLPLLAGHTAVPLPGTHVQVTPVRMAATSSVTIAPVMVTPPMFLGVTVYTTSPPAGATPPTRTLVILKLGLAMRSSSVALLSLRPGGVGSVSTAGAVIVAVFTRLPVAVGDRSPSTVSVAVALGGRFTTEVMSCAAFMVVDTQVPPTLVQVNVTLLSLLGTGSVIAAPLMVPAGPVLVATMLYFTCWPGMTPADGGTSSLVIDRLGCNTSFVSIAALFTGVASRAASEAGILTSAL